MKNVLVLNKSKIQIRLICKKIKYKYRKKLFNMSKFNTEYSDYEKYWNTDGVEWFPMLDPESVKLENESLRLTTGESGKFRKISTSTFHGHGRLSQDLTSIHSFNVVRNIRCLLILRENETPCVLFLSL